MRAEHVPKHGHFGVVGNRTVAEKHLEAQGQGHEARNPRQTDRLWHSVFGLTRTGTNPQVTQAAISNYTHHELLLCSAGDPLAFHAGSEEYRRSLTGSALLPTQPFDFSLEFRSWVVPLVR
jgi:hypothetical protein